MPGFELIDQEELNAIQEIFHQSGGILFAHGFDAQRKGIYRVRELEKEAALRLGARHCQAVTSGTAAQFVALKALGIQPGDEVITQAFTFVATVEAIVECGATPVVVNVDETLNLDPEELSSAITDRTKAIVPVHMLGNPARMDEILKIAASHQIPVCEDACEAFGATYKGKSVGTLGQAGFLSLDFGKTITAGEGGLIFTDDSSMAQKMAAYHDHGHENNPKFPRGRDTAAQSGFNFRMTEMQAAVARVQLKKLDRILEANRKNKSLLKEHLSTLGDRIRFREITDPHGELADTLMFFVESEQKATAIVKSLNEKGVGTKNVPDAVEWHFAQYWSRIWEKTDRYQKSYPTVWKKSAALLSRCISLPIMVKWEKADIEQLAKKVCQSVLKSS